MITHDNLERDYRIYIPASYDGSKAFPLVFNLHGFGSNGFQQQFYSEMGETAQENDFLVCFPNGVDNAWNVGWANGSTADDVGFISALIDHLSAEYNIEPNQVYSCGMSNGGFMSYRLACELNDKIAAVASVTGSFSPDYFGECEPGKSVPALEIHGTADLVVPYNGSPTLSIGIEEVISFWTENNQCVLSPDTTIIEDIVTTDSSTAIQVDYKDCDLETQVSLIKIDGGGHTWPGASFDAGVTNQDFNASQAIWDFFEQFTLCNQGTTALETINIDPLVLYPNPSNSELNIRGNSIKKSNYQIINHLGNIVQDGKLLDGKIGIQNIPTGHYILRIKSQDKDQTTPFVKI